MGSLSRMFGARQRAAIAASVATAAACIGLLGCGEKGEPPTTGKVVPQTTVTESTGSTTTETDGSQASEAALNFLTLPGAPVCDSGVTEKLLRKMYGSRAKCIAKRKSGVLAGSVNLGDAKVQGGAATVVATAKGGSYGKGKKLTLRLVRDGSGAWRVDGVN